MSINIYRRWIGYLNFFTAKVTTKKCFTRWLQDRFLALIHTCCTKIVRWLCVFHAWLQRKGLRSKSEFGQLISLRLTFPIFQFSQLVFKFGYAVGEKRLLLLGREGDCVGLQELGVYLRDCGHDLVEIGKSLRGLKKGHKSLDTLR